jgi:DNA-binding NarL/FixJ family response regulator
MAKKPRAGPLERTFGITLEQGRELAERWASLTPREKQVAEMIADGRKNAFVAGDLGISTKTQDIFRAKAAAKLGVPPVGFGKVVYYLRMAWALRVLPRPKPPQS